MSADDVADLVQKVLSGKTPAEQRELLGALLAHQGAAMFDDLDTALEPTLRRKPQKVRGFQLRLDLRGAKPPVWRRLVVPGDLTLDQVSEVVLASMGWAGYHLHRFRTGADYRSPSFVTEMDLDEGEEGVLEDDVRLDQVVRDVGERLWFEYDFGDGWEHVLKIEKVLDDPPSEVEVVTGKRACPPEDVGGMGGYEAVAEWVESGYDDALLPDHFEDVDAARDWLPVDWHPAEFDIDVAREDVRLAMSGPS